MPFVGRQAEIQALDQFSQQPRAGLLILYGRRRIGKTSLLSHWVDQRKIERVLFWTATTHGSAYQLRQFSQALMGFDPRSPTPPPIEFSFASWDAAFEYLYELVSNAKGPQLVIIDEFTHLLQSELPLASVLQRVWDHRLSRLPNLRLILTGSLIGMVEQEVLSGRAPLYGRATAILKLRSLSFGIFPQLFPRWTVADRVAVYAVCGGIPAYLDIFLRAGQFTQGLKAGLEQSSIMLTDATLLLHDQLKEPQIYASVLATLANGFHTWKEIGQMAGVENGSLGYYLKNLQALDLIEKRDPIFSTPTSHKSRYHVRDPFLRFYYRFIAKHMTEINRGELTGVVKAIAEDLRAFIGTHVFEELCRDWVWAAAGLDKLGFFPEEAGSFWSQQQGYGVQLDVVAASPREKRLFIGECKWGTGSIARNVLTDLIARSQRMPQVGQPEWKTQYGLFARDHFTVATIAQARENHARLVTLSQIESDLVDILKRPPATFPTHVEFW